MPALLDEAGAKQIRLEDGRLITITTNIFASIPVAQRSKAFEWLRKNGFASVIKSEVALQFGMGEEEKANKVIGLLRKAGFAPEFVENVHSQTLKSLVRERLVEGKKLPASIEFISIPTTKISNPKGK